MRSIVLRFVPNRPRAREHPATSTDLRGPPQGTRIPGIIHNFDAVALASSPMMLPMWWKKCTFAVGMNSSYLVISSNTDLVRIAARHVVCITSDGNYSTIVQTGNELRVVTTQLGQLERMIADQLPDLGRTFVRIGKSLIININSVHYINIPKQQLVLVDALQNRHSLTASKEALKALKELIEKGELQ